MKIKIILAIVIIIFTFGCQTKQKMQEDKNLVKEKDSIRNVLIFNQRQILQNFAFCACLQHHYPSNTTITDDGSMAAYFEKSNYPMKAYEIIDSLAKEFSKKEYKSKHKKSLILMKSLDFYNSPELQKKISELDSMLNES